MSSSKQNNDDTTNRRRSQSSSEHWVPNEQFWDTLPRILLTNGALIELNRRNQAKKSAQALEKPRQPLRRRSERLRRRRRRLTENQYLPSLPVADATKLQRFARHGGPNLTNIRGFPYPTMANPIDPSLSPAETTPAQTKTSRPYDANYEAKLNQAGIFLQKERNENGKFVLPTNFDEIKARLNLPRKSLSPSRFTEENFETFCEDAEQAKPETQNIQKSVNVIEGRAAGIYSLTGAGPFNNLQRFRPDLAMAWPDSYDGAQPLSVDQRVLDDLTKVIVPNTDETRPLAPNFYLEGKSREASVEVAKRHAAHVGAIGARAILSLQNYQSQTPTYDRKAYSFTSFYHDGILRLNTTHATASKTADNDPRYYMTPVQIISMTQSSEEFRRGATWYRNARDLAKEIRERFIEDANKKITSATSAKS